MSIQDKMNQDAARFVNGAGGMLYGLKTELDDKLKSYISNMVQGDNPLSGEDMLVMQALLQEHIIKMQAIEERLTLLEEKIHQLTSPSL